MIPHRSGELGRRSPPADLDIVIRVLAGRNRFVRNIGNSQCEIVQTGFRLPELFLHGLNAGAQLFHSRHGLFGRLPIPLQPRHLIRALLELMAMLFDQRREGPPFGDGLFQIGPGHVGSSTSQRGPKRVKIVPKVSEIVHMPSPE